jgi:hypothetical protein
VRPTKLATVVVALGLVALGCTEDERRLWDRLFDHSPEVALEAATNVAPEDLHLDVVVLTEAAHESVERFLAEPPPPPPALTPRDIGFEMTCARWGCSAFTAVDWIIERESRWTPDAWNDDSGACGLPQALPCSKLPGYPHDVRAQLGWFFSYVEDRYGSVWGAQDFWSAHGWY